MGSANYDFFFSFFFFFKSRLRQYNYKQRFLRPLFFKIYVFLLGFLPYGLATAFLFQHRVQFVGQVS